MRASDQQRECVLRDLPHVHVVRQQQHKVGTLKGHTQEVCGLKWSPSGNQLASGGNDNILTIWDDRYTASSTSSNGCMANDVSLHRLDAHLVTPTCAQSAAATGEWVDVTVTHP